MRTLIRNGVVYDGTGASGFAADVLVQDDTIEAVAPELDAEADEVLDTAGMAVTPGFIDTHRHCDTAALTDPDFGRIETAQGLTTIIGGNCGLAPLPVRPETARQISDYIEPCLGPTPDTMRMEHFHEYVDALDKTDKPLNIGSYVGIGTLRAAVKGYGRAPFTQKELDWARGYIDEAMQAGAVGLTTGIMYQPECYSSRKEFVELISAAAPYGRVLATHIRGEGDNLVPSVAEVIEIAKEAGVPLNISHFKVTGVKNWGKNILEAIALIEKARAAGQDVTADFYPYDGGSTTLVSLLPPTLMKDTMAETLAALSTAQGRADARREIYADHPGVQAELHHIHTITQKKIVPPTREEVNKAFEKYGMQPGANKEVVGVAAALAKEAIEKKDLSGSQFYLLVVYSLTNDPEVKELLEKVSPKKKAAKTEAGEKPITQTK